jgi:hypothetical protein
MRLRQVVNLLAEPDLRHEVLVIPEQPFVILGEGRKTTLTPFGRTLIYSSNPLVMVGFVFVTIIRLDLHRRVVYSDRAYE